MLRSDLGTPAQACARPQPPCGFTLLEALASLLILMMLAGIGYPALQDHLRKGRRHEAAAGLATLQLAQERWRLGSNEYAASLQALAWAPPSAGSHYEYSVQGASGLGYTVVATARQGSAQAQDPDCAQMALSLSGSEVQRLAGGAGQAMTARGAAGCWPA